MDEKTLSASAPDSAPDGPIETNVKIPQSGAESDADTDAEKPRKRGRPKKKKTNTEKPSPARIARATGIKTPPEEAVDPHDQLQNNLDAQRRIVEEIRRRHPDSEIAFADPRIPAPAKLERAIIEPVVVEMVLITATDGLARAIKSPGRPSEKQIAEAASHVSEASKYWGATTISPRTAATMTAISAIIMCFTPVLLAKLGENDENDETG